MAGAGSSSGGGGADISLATLLIRIERLEEQADAISSTMHCLESALLSFKAEIGAKLDSVERAAGAQPGARFSERESRAQSSRRVAAANIHASPQEPSAENAAGRAAEAAGGEREEGEFERVLSKPRPHKNHSNLADSLSDAVEAYNSKASPQLELEKAAKEEMKEARASARRSSLRNL